ncbi:chap domain [Caudoviricetes sp.]|nr:chap domain [Caudoviricetes sp.]
MIGVTALGDAWPVKKTASVQQMCEWAEQARCRYVAAKSPAQVGDLFCLYYPKLKRWAHVGIITAVEANGKTVRTIEGNTSGSGSREGWLVAEKTRTLTEADRLIRWVGVLNP